MIRTQVYLPRSTYEKLQARAKAHQLTMAVQIREALEAYIERSERVENSTVLRADDPLFQLAGIGEGPPDMAAGHDRYLYGDSAAPRVKERPASYGGAAKKPRKVKRSKKRK